MTHRVCPWWLGYWLISPLPKYGLNIHRHHTARKPDEARQLQARVP